jgi:hypothetical protein
MPCNAAWVSRDAPIAVLVEPVGHDFDFLVDCKPWVPATWFDDQVCLSARFLQRFDQNLRLMQRHERVRVATPRSLAVRSDSQWLA